MKRFFVVLVVLLAGVAPAPAAQGVKGRSSLGGTLVEQIEVRAYGFRPGGFGPLTGDAPAGTTLTATDGSYRLELPPGRYVVEALKKKGGNRGKSPEAGDLYCLYSGSPVTVTAGQWTAVGLYLVTVAPERRGRGENARVSGNIVFKGEPVERAYLYAYASADGAFRGPADLLQPVAKGAFSVRLPPGVYYLVARKRMRGGAYGPIDTGDLFNFYPGNPVRLAEGEEVALEIPLVERLNQLEEESGTYRGVRVQVLDEKGGPLAGYYVLAYPNAARTGPPSATSAPTDKDGATFVNLPPDAPHLRARVSLGGPLEERERFADGEAAPGSAGPIVLRLAKPQ